LKDDEFLFFWIDSIVGQIQYGKRSNMCNVLKLKSLVDQFAYFVDLAKQNTVYEYGSYYLKNESFALEVNFKLIQEWSRLQIMVLSELHGVWILADSFCCSSLKIFKTRHQFL
jgi:hypothetical protein